ncbi:MAG: purine/pyrimidine permease [Gemmatimonadota bacterium]|nr:purine/pyrimidine permease [Gemmatimonadota bacterium]MDE2871170.1 purine/pyrimidine permease [Gemmatimonadota bacterium]
MDSPAKGGGPGVRYQPDEKPPWPLAAGLALQYCILALGGIVLTVAIVIRSAERGEVYLAWAAFGALLVSGVATIIQAARLGRLGAGYVLTMGTSGAFIAVSVAALQQGGPILLATLVIASSLFQFLLAGRLSLLRRILTPTVAGTVIMLIAVNVMPFLFDFLDNVPEAADPLAAPATVLVTLGVTLAVMLRFTGPARLWGPLIGIVAGCLAAWFFGILDGHPVAQAMWVGVPVAGSPGIGFDFGPAFWGLLPAYTFVTLVGAIETIGDAVGIQRVSWRDPRATDYRAVQGAVAADGLGNLLSGLFATVPNTTYSSSVSIVEITGIAARRVGVCIGLIFCALAFLPKVTQLLLIIPDPVIGAYAMVIIAVLFMLGTRIVLQDGMDYRKATIVGFSFWVGVGFQSGQISTEGLSPFLQQMLANGMTSGGLTALLLTAFAELAGRRRVRMQTALGVESLTAIHRFLEDFADREGLAGETAGRLAHAAEETLLLLVGEADQDGRPGERRLRLTARTNAGGVELEFLAAGSEGNIEDRLAVIGGHVAEAPGEHEFSLRLLRHIATSVQHHKYADTDVVTVRVDPVTQPA